MLGPPGWIQLDYATEVTPVMPSAIDAVVNISPGGFANHSIFVDGALATTWAGNMTNGEVLTWRAGSPIKMSTIKVVTTAEGAVPGHSSPSWVAWDSITAYSC